MHDTVVWTGPDRAADDCLDNRGSGHSQASVRLKYRRKTRAWWRAAFCTRHRGNVTWSPMTGCSARTAPRSAHRVRSPRLLVGGRLSIDAALNGEAHPLAVLEELLLNRRFRQAWTPS
jgi:hypothetical protein